MSDIRISVGAAIDSSFAQVFGQVEALAAKARTKVASEAAAMGKAQEIAAQKAGAAQERAYDKALAALEKDNQKSVASAEKTAAQEIAIAEKAAQRKGAAELKAFDKRIAASAKAAAAEEKDILKVAAVAEKAAENASAAAEKSRRQALLGGARSALGTAAGFARGAGHLGMQVAHAAGVDLDVGSNVKASMHAKATAALLSRKGFQEGQEGVAGQKQDPTAVLKDMETAADATAHSTKDVGDAMMAFVNKSGDLEGARGMMGMIGALANSTGADFQKLSADAGVLSLKLDSTFGADKAGKMKAIDEILRGLSAQGKLGAIDMAELAAQLPKLLAVAGRFGGDRARMMSTVGFLAQESAKQGGSGSAAQAATSVTALAGALGKARTAAAFKASGIDIFEDKKGTTLRDPMTIIEKALLKTGGSQVNLSKLIGSQQALRGIEGLRQIFVQAGGGEKGLEAIHKEFKELGGAALSSATVQEDNAARLKEAGAKAQVFQNNLERVAGSMAEKVMPALEKLAPVVLKVADSFAGVVGWAADNPGKAISAAIVLSIGKAAIGSVVGSALKRFIEGGPGGGGGAGGLGGAGGGKLGSALAVAGAGVAGWGVGSALANAMADQRDAATSARSDVQARTLNATIAANAASRKGKVSTEDQAAIEAEAARIKERIANVKDDDTTLGGANNFLKSISVSGQDRAEVAQVGEDKQNLTVLQGQLEKLQAEMAKVHAGTLKVQVMNASEIGASQASPGTDAGAVG